MIKTVLCACAFAVVASTSSWAAAPKDMFLSPDKTMVVLPRHTIAIFTPNFVHKAKSATIYSNLANAYPKGIYFSGEGSTLCGQNCGLGQTIWEAAGFTPSASATAKEVQVGVGLIAGADQITIAIYSDNNGTPGTALWSGVAKSLPTFGDCCALAKVKIKDGLALAGGTPYWIVATTDKKQTTTFAAWTVAEVDQVDAVPAAGNINDGGWKVFSTTTPPAFGVFSK